MTAHGSAGRRNTVKHELTAAGRSGEHDVMPTNAINRTAPGAPYVGDHSEYLRAVARMIRAAGDRIADGDPSDLAELAELRAHLELAIGRALRSQSERFSLSELATELGVTRQAVHYSVKRAAGDTP